MGYSGVLRGGKHNTFDGGVRAPFIIRWPGRVRAGATDTKSAISGIDWLPTLCSIAGVKIESSEFEGEDVSAAWFSQATQERSKPLL